MKVTLYMDVYPGKVDCFSAYDVMTSSPMDGITRVKFTVEIPEKAFEAGEVKAGPA